jgi:hypothetical protein
MVEAQVPATVAEGEELVLQRRPEYLCESVSNLFIYGYRRYLEAYMRVFSGRSLPLFFVRQLVAAWVLFPPGS